MRFTEAAIAQLPPEETEYAIWDARVEGFGVRVRPSGGRSYIYLAAGKCRRRRTLGRVGTMTLAEARRRHLAAVAGDSRRGPEGSEERRPVPTFRDFVAGEWRQGCYVRYKPSTRDTTDSYLRVRLLPAFGSVALDRIAPADVHDWFDRSSARAPGAANRALEILHQILNYAVSCEHIPANPSRGIRQNPKTRITRFLSKGEIGRLHRTLDRCVAERPRLAPPADIVRLLLLTGCRVSEIRCLRRRDLKGGTLDLGDSKTGPRPVYLSAEARAILDRQPRHAGPYVFPSPKDAGRPRSPIDGFWLRVRRRSGLDDVRLHDLRHTFASHAVMQGLPLPVVARLLGHRNVRMTLRYAHVRDREVEAAAERVGVEIASLCGKGAF